MKKEAIKLVKKHFKIIGDLEKSKNVSKVDLQNTINALYDTISHEEADYYQELKTYVDVIKKEDIQ